MHLLYTQPWAPFDPILFGRRHGGTPLSDTHFGTRSVGQSIVPTNLLHPARPPLHPAAGKTILGGPGHTTLLSTLTSM